MPIRRVHAHNSDETLTDIFTYDWNPEHGTMLSFPEQELSVEGLADFNQAYTKAVSKALEYDVAQQKTFLNPSLFGLREISDDTYGNVWIAPDIELDDFGTPYLMWEITRNMQGARTHGEWVLRLAGIRNEQLAIVGRTRWDNKEGLHKLATDCMDQELILVMLAMENPEQVREETERWQQEKSAREVAQNSVSRTTHVPYTSVAKKLREDQNCVTTYSRTRVIALQLPGSRISPAVLIDIPQDRVQEATFARLQQEGYFRVNIEIINPRTRNPYVDSRYTVWGKDQELLHNNSSSAFLGWITAKASTIAGSWHKPKQSATV